VARTHAPELVTREGVHELHVSLAVGPRLFGVLTAFRRGVPFAVADAELLGRLARSSAAAIANAIDFERERTIARALTRGFVPESLPDLPGYDVGLVYEPAASQPAGGDLYGAWPLPAGGMAVLVGDVAGKGIETAALSAMARFFIEARTWDCESPAEALRQANSMLRSRLPDDAFVTAFLGALTEDGLRYATAGHLPPLLVRAGASEATEVAGRGLALGVEDDPAFGDLELTLEPGDLLVAYTDGLSEARLGREMLGAERLGEALVAQAREGGGAEAIARGLHAHVRGWAGALSDDAVALALLRR
jgi:serine phosphatase RsbU (regulator of sigma subunit)